jgi:hypothetical protein
MKEETAATSPAEAPVVPPAPLPAPAPTPEPAQAIAAPAAGLNVSEALAQDEPSPFYKKWWFWSAVGAVVVAGTVTAIVLAKGGKGACSGEESVCLGVK